MLRDERRKELREMFELCFRTELTDQLAVERFGYVWMSFLDTPVKGTKDDPEKGTKAYPEKQRVRQLMSPGQMAQERWQEFFATHEGRPADGTEPLAYCYCSMGRHPAELPSLSAMGFVLSQKLIPLLLDELDRASEVANWAQAMLTALNVGNVEKGSQLHLKLREVMVDFREPEPPDDIVLPVDESKDLRVMRAG